MTRTLPNGQVQHAVHVLGTVTPELRKRIANTPATASVYYVLEPGTVLA